LTLFGNFLDPYLNSSKVLCMYLFIFRFDALNCKMIWKESVLLPQGVNFINVLCLSLSFESALSSFSLVTCGSRIFGAKFLFEKCERKTLMKLTAVLCSYLTKKETLHVLVMNCRFILEFDNNNLLCFKTSNSDIYFNVTSSKLK